MKSIAFHSKLHLHTREFHIHTGSIPEKQIVISEIFEKGQYISSRQLPFLIREDDNTANKIRYLKSIASELHQGMMEELKMLFYIHKKLQPLKKYLAHYKLGSIFYSRNILKEAIENFEQAIQLNEEFVASYILLGKCYIKKEQYAKAVDIFEKGLKIKPNYPDLANSMGVALTFEKDYNRAAGVLQDILRKKPDFHEANFNLGIVLFLSTLEGTAKHDKAVVPSRVTRSIQSLTKLDRYKDSHWQESFEQTINRMSEGTLDEILGDLADLQFKLLTHLKIDISTESFYLKFMYGGRELSFEELDSYERRIRGLEDKRQNFADYWNEMGIIHIIQCRHLFLKSVEEFEKAVGLNTNYLEASNNLELIKNIKKGFLILLRAILK